jgi:uroporphyrin-III C-methyltransferase / precorrin-2 dehydrogenase / sirohydrochlorin ferrochelatase
VDWEALGRMTGTLVILMGIERIGAIAATLVAGGRDPQTPVAVIQEGTMPGERRVQTTLGLIAEAVAEAGIRPPAIVVVGPVVGLV